MPSNKGCLLGLLLISASGCDSTPASLVYVDLERAYAATEKHVVEVKAPTDAPAGVAQRVVEGPGTPGGTLELDATAARRAIDSNRAMAERQLSQELGTLYLRELRAEEARLLREADPASRAKLESALAGIRPIFERYAVKRAPAVARLAAIVGFPDPNPRSLPPTRPLERFAAERTAEAERLRKKISEMDLEYDREVAAHLGSARTEADALLTEVRAIIGGLRSDAVDRAEREAAATVERFHNELEAAAMNDVQLKVEGQPAERTQLPPVEAPADAPTIQRAAVAKAAALKSLETEAKVWASTRGLELTSTKSGNRDGTAEFIAWKKERVD